MPKAGDRDPSLDQGGDEAAAVAVGDADE